MTDWGSFYASEEVEKFEEKTEKEDIYSAAPVFPWEKGGAAGVVTEYPWEKIGIKTAPDWTPPEGVTPMVEWEWWEMEESYTNKVNSPKGEWSEYSPFPIEAREPTLLDRLQKSPYYQEVPDPNETTWEAMWRGVRSRAWLATETIKDTIEPISESDKPWRVAREKYGEVLNYLFGSPFDLPKPKAPEQERGVVWDFALSGLFKAARQVAGFGQRIFGRQGEISSTKASLLSAGVYAETVDRIVGKTLSDYRTGLFEAGISQDVISRLERAGLLQDVRTLRTLGLTEKEVRQLSGGEIDIKRGTEMLETAEFEQSRFIRRVDLKVEKEGKSRQAAIEETLKEMDSSMEEAPKLSIFDLSRFREGSLQEQAQAFANGDRVLPWSQSANEAWELSKGFRWSHAWDWGLNLAFEDYVDQGMSPEQAGDLTEDPVLEAWSSLILDPNWIIPIDNLAVTAVLTPLKGGIKAVSRGLGFVAENVPLFRGGYEWAIGITANTAGNYAARSSVDIVRMARKYMSEHGMVVSAERIQRFLTVPGSEFLEQLPRYYQRAWDLVGEQLPDAFKKMDEVFSDNLIAKAIDGLDEAEAIVRHNELFEEGLEKLKGTAYAQAKAARLAENPWIDSKFVHAMTNNIVAKFVTGVKSVAIDSWLGLRPSWNIFNKIDNTAKMIIDGVDMRTSMRAFVTDYSFYAPDILDTTSAIESLIRPKFFSFSAETANEYVQQLSRVVPGEILATFSKELGREASVLRKVPGVKQFLETNYAQGGKIEAAARARTYFTKFFDSLYDG